MALGEHPLSVLDVGCRQLDGRIWTVHFTVDWVQVAVHMRGHTGGRRRGQPSQRLGHVTQGHRKRARVAAASHLAGTRPTAVPGRGAAREVFLEHSAMPHDLRRNGESSKPSPQLVTFVIMHIIALTSFESC
jgi:hypothetical protein